MLPNPGKSFITDKTSNNNARATAARTLTMTELRGPARLAGLATFALLIHRHAALRPAKGRAHYLASGHRGDLLEKLGRHVEARAEFKRAASMTRNERERALLDMPTGRNTSVPPAL